VLLYPHSHPAEHSSKYPKTDTQPRRGGDARSHNALRETTVTTLVTLHTTKVSSKGPHVKLILVIGSNGSIVRVALVANDQARVEHVHLPVGGLLHGGVHVRLRRQARQEQVPRSQSISARADMVSWTNLVPFKANVENHRTEVVGNRNQHIFIAACTPLEELAYDIASVLDEAPADSAGARALRLPIVVAVLHQASQLAHHSRLFVCKVRAAQ